MEQRTKTKERVQQKHKNESKASGTAPCQRIKLHDTQNDHYDYLISNKFKIFGITLKFILIIQDKLIYV